MDAASRKLSKTHTSSSLGSSTTTNSDASATQSQPQLRPLPAILTDGLPLPRLVVFDLDYTLWPFWCDTHPSGPLRAARDNTHCTDRTGDRYAFYADSPAILQGLRLAGVPLAVASKTSAPDVAGTLLKALHVPPAAKLFAPPLLPEGGGGGAVISKTAEAAAKEKKSRRALDLFCESGQGGTEMYYSPSKLKHFAAIQKRTKVEYADMLFFDDERPNRDVERQLGVTMQLVTDGMTWRELENGIKAWRQRRQSAAS